MNTLRAWKTLGGAALLLILSGQSGVAQWTPTGQLAQVPVIENCAVTAGDIAVFRKPNGVPTIFYCQAVANAINARFPEAGRFYYVHEFAHAAGILDEDGADCWAARQLASAPNGTVILRSAIAQFRSRGSESHPGYSTAAQRADNIKRCAGLTDDSGGSRSRLSDDGRQRSGEGAGSYAPPAFDDPQVTTAPGADPLVALINSQDPARFTDSVGENHFRISATRLSNCQLVLSEYLQSQDSDNFTYRRTAKVSVPLRRLDLSEDGISVEDGSSYFSLEELHGWWVNIRTLNEDELIMRESDILSTSASSPPKHEIKSERIGTYSLYFSDKDTAENVARVIHERSKTCQK